MQIIVIKDHSLMIRLLSLDPALINANVSLFVYSLRGQENIYLILVVNNWVNMC